MVALFFLAFRRPLAAETAATTMKSVRRVVPPLPPLRSAGEKALAGNNCAFVRAASDFARGIVCDDLEDEKFSIPAAISRRGGDGRANRRRGGVANIDMCADRHFASVQERMKHARAGQFH